MNTDKSQAQQLPQDAVMQSVLKESDLRIGNFIKVISTTKTFDSFIFFTNSKSSSNDIKGDFGS